MDEARQALASRLTFPQNGKIVFQDGDAVWVATPGELGLAFDARANALAAYEYGRQGNPLLRTFRLIMMLDVSARKGTEEKVQFVWGHSEHSRHEDGQTKSR